jgi:hypothetical protein
MVGKMGHHRLQAPNVCRCAFDYIGYKNEVVLSRYWWIKVQKEHSVPKGELSQPTKVTYQIRLVRLRDIHTVTEEQYKTEMIAEHRTP